MIATAHRPTPAARLLAALMLDADDRSGVFGDRDAGTAPAGRPRPPGCGLFGRIGDDPKLRPDNGRGRPPALPQPIRPPRG